METLSRKQLAGMAIVRREKAARAWAPPAALSRLRRLAADRTFTVRYLVAANLRTPQVVLDSLAADPHPMVAWAASRRAGSSPDCGRIPIAVIKQIMHQCVDDDDSCEATYNFALLGLFDIDDSGHVWRTGRLRKDRHDDALVGIEWHARKPARKYRNGYAMWVFVCHCLRIETFSHRLIHRAFIGRIPRGYLVHHKDGDRGNNHPGNLEVMLGTEHGRRHVRETGPWNAILTPDEVREIRKLLAGGASCAQVADRYAVCTGCIRNIWTGKTWRNVK